MIPLHFPDKRTALTGAFLNRFTIGVVIGVVIGATIGAPAWLVGIGVGVLISAADAVITKGLPSDSRSGAPGGAIIGEVIARWGR